MTAAQPSATTAVEQQVSGAVPSRGGSGSTGSSAGAVARGTWRVLAPLVVSLVVGVVVWYGALKAFSISPLVGKTPAAVWQYLFTEDAASSHRRAVLDAMRTTLRDAALGFVVGMAAAVVVALAFVLVRSVEQSLMPIALVLRSVPLVAMTPLIGLVFHQGGGTVVMGAVVVFFPALVNVVQGLRSVHAQTRDLVVAYGGSDLVVLTKVGLPTALPSLFAAARISVPGALIGALVGEWLLTAKGIGGTILSAIGGFDYGQVWADIVVLTAVSVVLYTVVGALENLVLARFAPERLAR